MDGAMVLVVVFAAHRVDAMRCDLRAGLLDHRDDVVAAGRKARIREILLDHLGHTQAAQRAVGFVAAVDAGMAATATTAEHQRMDACTGAGQLGQAAAATEFDVVGVGADCQNVENHGRVLAETKRAAGRWTASRVKKAGTIATSSAQAKEKYEMWPDRPQCSPRFAGK
jgi:hypothetical protein